MTPAADRAASGPGHTRVPAAPGLDLRGQRGSLFFRWILQRGRLAQVWPELAETPEVTDAEGVYPRPFWDFIHHTGQRYPHYPLFHTNSCALAYVLSQPDRFGVYGSTTCRVRNNCPLAQRDRCSAAALHRRSPTSDQISAALHRRGLTEADFTLAPDGQELTIDAAVDTATTAALTQDLGIRVKVTRQETDAYWNSGTAGALPLVLE